MVFLIICSYIIISLEVCSLLNQLNNQITMLEVQFYILLISVIVIKLSGFGLPKTIPISKNIYQLFQLIKKNRLIFLFSIIILSIYVFQLFVSIKFPPNTSDVLYNHLSRIGYWLQQGSLKPYNGFNSIGSTYPYNNSLLMLWTVVFLRSDVFIGFSQFISALVISCTIYEFSVIFGFSKKSAVLAGLTFLTFPIVVLQATTAQNDLLVAAFASIACLLLMKFFLFGSTSRIVFSSLALALAIGTKQYAFFILPGYLGLCAYYIFKKRQEFRKVIIPWVFSLLLFTIALGMYAYIQNILFFGSFFGETSMVSTTIKEFSEPSSIIKKLSINSSRLFSQFISCEGLPLTVENSCLEIKNRLFSNIFTHNNFNIESRDYLLEQSHPFYIDERQVINEESSWFGVNGWILILPSVIIGLFFFISKKRLDIIFLFLTSLIHFAIISVFMNGWNPYIGRYLIISTVLIMPFTALVFTFFQKHFWRKLFILVYSSFCLFVMMFSIVNNVSRPLISKTQLVNLQIWGRSHSPFIQKIAYKIVPLANNWYDIWQLNDIDVKTLGARDYKYPLLIVENYVPETSTLGIVAQEGFVMDYLFFGDNFEREIIAITDYPNSIPSNPSADFLLLSPDYELGEYPGYRFVISNKGWKLYRWMPN